MPGDSDPAQRRRILYVEANEDGTVGGSHRILFDLIHHLDRERYEPIALFYQENPYCSRLRRAGVEVHLYEEARTYERWVRENGSSLRKHLDFVTAIWRRFQTIRELKVDLVHLNNSPTVGFDDWLPACRLGNIPCIVNAIGQVGDSLGPLQRTLLRGFDRVLACSNEVVETLESLELRNDVDLVPLAVDTGSIRSASVQAQGLREELDLSEDELIVAMVGNVRPWKGQALVLEAVAALPESTKNKTTLLVVGDIAEEDREYGDRITERARCEDLKSHVRFLGYRDDVPRIFSAADVAIHASKVPEPFGLVILEAMAVGTPVIAADRGGPVDIIISAGAGELVDPENTSELARVLERLLEDPGLRQRMATAARKRADAFDIELYVNRVETVYDELLALADSSNVE